MIPMTVYDPYRVDSKVWKLALGGSVVLALSMLWVTCAHARCRLEL